MKIFILAFCIFQISLAQTPADRINYDYKAALTASHTLARQTKFVIDKNGQLSEVVIGPAIHYFKFLSDLVSKLKKIKKYKKLASALEKLLNTAKSAAGGFSKAEITLETVAALATFNLYADVLNGLNAKAKLNSDFTPNPLPRTSLPADFKVPKISQEIFNQLEDDYIQFVRAVYNLGKYKDLFVNNFDSFGQSILSHLDLFVENTVDGLAQTIDPEASKIIGNSVGTMKTQLVDVVKYIVNKGTPLGEVVWEIIINGANSILTSYEQLILAAQLQLNESK